MALLKNLYIDLGFLNPFKKKEKTNKVQETKKYNPSIMAVNSQTTGPGEAGKSHMATGEVKELPHISKKLLENAQTRRKEELRLPTMQKISQPAKIVAPQDPVIQSKELNINLQSTKVQGYESTHTSQEQTLIFKQPSSISDPRQAKEEDGFFTSMESHVLKEDEFIRSEMPKQVLYSNLLGEMQSFWKNQKYEARKSHQEGMLKEDLAKKIRELHDLEIGWQRLQLESEKVQDELASKEILIENHVRQLKKAFKRIHANMDFGEENCFRLIDGQKLRNLQELHDTLRTMDDKTFYFHVTSDKNDFCNWVEQIIQLPDLSQNMKSAKNKAQMADIIENWTETS